MGLKKYKSLSSQPSTSFKPFPQPIKKNPYSGRSSEQAATSKRHYVSSLKEVEVKASKIGRSDANILTEEVPQFLDEPRKSDDIVLRRLAHAPTPNHGNFKISDVDINLIINRKELTDHIIGAAQIVLRNNSLISLVLKIQRLDLFQIVL